MFPDSDDEAVAALAEELMRCERPIEVVLRPVSAFHLVAILQLALRHPHVPDDARRMGEMFIGHVRGYFEHEQADTVVEAIRRGDDPTFDCVRESAEPLMRLYHRTLGGHVHCRLFVRAEGSSAQSGTLVFSLEEWPAIRDSFAQAPWLDIIDEAAVQ
jgi:hypothetical protein